MSKEDIYSVVQTYFKFYRENKEKSKSDNCSYIS